jgi:hypothetical protein
MIEVISESKPVARKKYRCDACEYVLNEVNQGTFTIAEYRLIVAAKRNGYAIVPGQQYIKQFNKDGGDTYTFRGIPAMHDLCVKYDLYPEW